MKIDSETLIGVWMHDDPSDVRTYELAVIASGLVVLRSYVEDQLVASISSLGGATFAEELAGLMADPSVSVVLAGLHQNEPMDGQN